MRNAAARFNLNSFQVIGPRQGLIVALLQDNPRLTASQIARKFKLPKGAAGTILTTCKSLVRKGLVVMDTAPAKVSTDGAFYGAVFSLTAEGVKLARRMQKITGLGNTFAVVRGRTPTKAA